MSKASNPFYFESPSDRWSFTDREDLLPQLVTFMSERNRRMLIHGRRRMGKTSLMQNAAKKAGAAFLYCDVSKAASLPELAKKLLESAPQAENDGLLSKVLGIAKKHFKTVVLAAGKITLSGELKPDQGAQTLEDVLNYLNEQAGIMDKPWTICFDEFQDIKILMGERAAWQLRGIVQGHRNVNFLFSGSDHRLVKWMTSPDAAFFKQLTQMEVRAIAPAHLADWIARRAKIGGLARFPYGGDIVAIAGPCTGDVVRLAKVVFDLVASGKTDGVVKGAFDAIALVELNTEFGAYWRDMTSAQRLMMRAIAAGKPPHASTTLREIGIKTPSSAQRAIVGLEAKQYLLRDGAKLAFDNPFLRRWVEFNGA